MLKNGQTYFTSWRCEHRKIFEACLAIFQIVEIFRKCFSIQIYFFRFYFQTPSFLNEFACAYVAEKYDVTGATKCNFLVEQCTESLLSI